MHLIHEKKKHIIYKTVSNKASERANSKKEARDLEEARAVQEFIRQRQSPTVKPQGISLSVAFYKEPYPKLTVLSSLARFTESC